MDVAEFKKKIGWVLWNTDYPTFCKILNLNPETKYSRKKWKQLYKLEKSLEAFGAFELESLMDQHFSS